MSFSENLKNALSQSNMTMTDLANSTGITYNMIKKYCAGGADPTVSYALKIAETLNVSIDELMDYRAPEQKNMFRQVFERDFTYSHISRVSFVSCAGCRTRKPWWIRILTAPGRTASSMQM